MNRPAALWLAVGWGGFALLPWYGVEDGFWSFAWLFDYPAGADAAPAALQVLLIGRWWLAPMALPLAAPLLVLWRPRTDPLFSRVLLAAGGAGAVLLLGQGFLIGIGGWEYATLEELFGPLGDRQFGMGYGALSVSAAFLFLFAQATRRARGPSTATASWSAPSPWSSRWSPPSSSSRWSASCPAPSRTTTTTSFPTSSSRSCSATTSGAWAA